MRFPLLDRCSGSILAVLACVAGLWIVPPANAAPARLSILFLGDNGHHRPADRFRQLAPVLKKRGIDLTYTDRVSDLNPKTLGSYDGLLIYANIEKITPEQEKALLEYVAGGKGLIPLHCASYCFLNSPKYISLVGAQFRSHGTGVFRTTLAAPDHPIMKGFGGFSSWDETYLHHKHNTTDRVVLEYRVEARSSGPGATKAVKEPWTWVRTHGKGRVFYTAWGHDGRTWGNPGFINLVERGIRWAVGGDPSVVPAYGDLPVMTTLAKDLPAFRSVDAKVPFYPPGERWGTMGKPITKMQMPAPPEESIRHMVHPADFELKLFASEKELGGKPICMNWDERGRLWVAVTVDYPNNRQPEGKGHDRILILEDTKGTGKADKVTVFADKLSIPTSLTFYKGGVIVHQAPHTLYLKDTKGSGKADVRKVLFTGWHTNDTHAGPSNLHYGLDNWIYGMVGYAGFDGTIGGEKQSFRTGFYRFKPPSPLPLSPRGRRVGGKSPSPLSPVGRGVGGESPSPLSPVGRGVGGESPSPLSPVGRGVGGEGSKLEFLRNTNNNSWGVGFSEEGILFGSTANGNPSVYLPIPNRYYESVRGWSSTVLGGISTYSRIHPITDKVRQVDFHGGFTAAAGHALYTARTYPRQYWNRTAFVTEPTGHLVATFVLEKVGSDFRSRNAFNLLASDDEWCAPIMAEVGPDGNMWVIDWYNYIVQHNPTPVGYKTGKGNAYESELRDKKHGRIYRLVCRNAPAKKVPTLADATPAGLVATLKNDNMLWRKHAQRLLVERGKTDVVPALLDLVKDNSVDEIGLNAGAIHALWTLHGLDAVREEKTLAVVVGALKHRSAGVRRNALGVLPHKTACTSAIVEGGLLKDADAQVRLAALLALAEMPADSKTGAALAERLTSAEDMADRWIPDALTSAAAAHALPFLEAVANVKASLPQRARTVIAVVATHDALGGSKSGIERVLLATCKAPPDLAEVILGGLARGWSASNTVVLKPDTDRALALLMPKLSATGKGSLLRLAAALGSKGMEKYSAEVVKSLLTTLNDPKATAADRIAAARQVVELRPTDEPALAQILDVISPRAGPTLIAGLLDAVAGSKVASLGTDLIKRLDTWTPSARSAALRILLSRPALTRSLLTALEKGEVKLAELALDQKQALAAHPDKAIAERARKLLARGGELPNPDRQKVIDRLMPLTKKTGNAGRGKEVFKAQCAKCHAHSGEGANIGPDLTGMAAHPKEGLLVDIFDPSRSVEGNFRLYTVNMLDGRVFMGMLASETRTTLEIIDAEAKRHPLQRAKVETLTASTKSLMPDGFEKQLKEDEIVDLLEFLTQRGKYLPLPLDKVATVVSTKGMFNDPESTAERLVFPDWKPKTFNGIPFYLVDPRGGKTANVVLLHSDNGTIPPKMPRAVSLTCNSAAKAIHLLSGVSGWGHPLGRKGSVSLIVRLHYKDGKKEDHELRNGVHFADYIRRVDVPESKFAFALRGRQIRYLAVTPKRDEVVATIELVKGPDRTAPVVMAVTVETK